MINNFAKTNKWIALKTSLRRLGISLDPFIWLARVGDKD
jgi:hypothetical protein